MILRLYWVLVAWLLCYSYSYSETINTHTKNIVGPGLTWANTLPQYTGLTVTAVNYKYTTLKLTSDPFLVTVANANATSTGYVFRSQDDWTGLHGNTITKTVSVDGIPGILWGSGSITTSGTGTVQDPEVKYSYRYDSCFSTATLDPSCPNYRQKLPSIPTSSEVQIPGQKQYEDDSEQQAWAQQLIKPEQTKKSQALKPFATNTLDNTKVFLALESASGLPKTYTVSLFGGNYADTVKLLDRRLPDSRNAQRLSASQELLHTKMVDQQYTLGVKK